MGRSVQEPNRGSALRRLSDVIDLRARGDPQLNRYPDVLRRSDRGPNPGSGARRLIREIGPHERGNGLRLGRGPDLLRRSDREPSPGSAAREFRRAAIVRSQAVRSRSPSTYRGREPLRTEGGAKIGFPPIGPEEFWAEEARLEAIHRTASAVSAQTGRSTRRNAGARPRPPSWFRKAAASRRLAPSCCTGQKNRGAGREKIPQS